MAEGGGLLNRYTVNSRIVGSNPIPSASILNLSRIPISGRPVTVAHKQHSSRLRQFVMLLLLVLAPGFPCRWLL